ncbi:MAG: trehalose-phosphatase [Alphaproteobacteria bacterium]|nr:trehalose-phosphatase [Alphaproteobacteria bacterium]
MTATEPRQDTPPLPDPADVALFLDVDGTLLDIAPRPDAVEVPPSLLRDLAAAAEAADGAVALVSGRPVAELDRLFAPLRLAASGVHGAELRLRPNDDVAALAEGRLGDEAWDALTRLLAGFPGSYAENKEVSFAVHYDDRGTDVAALKAALSRLMERMAAAGTATHLIAGHAVFELQLRGFDKGRAIRRFLDHPPFRGRRPVFIGDDEIDRAGFDTALALDGIAYSVGRRMPGLNGGFSSPAAVRAWLHEFGR